MKIFNIISSFIIGTLLGNVLNNWGINIPSILIGYFLLNIYLIKLLFSKNIKESFTMGLVYSSILGLSLATYLYTNNLIIYVLNLFNLN